MHFHISELTCDIYLLAGSISLNTTLPSHSSPPSLRLAAKNTNKCGPCFAVQSCFVFLLRYSILITYQP